MNNPPTPSVVFAAGLPLISSRPNMKHPPTASVVLVVLSKVAPLGIPIGVF